MPARTICRKSLTTWDQRAETRGDMEARNPTCRIRNPTNRPARSAHTGALIHRKFAGRPDVLLALELGGNNPLIVWPPVDVKAAANLIAHSAFATSGQRCSCARRLIVPQGAEGDAIRALVRMKSADHWRATLEPLDCCATIVRSIEEALADRHFIERGLFAYRAQWTADQSIAQTSIPIARSQSAIVAS